MRKFCNTEVEAVYSNNPAPQKKALLNLRELVLETAQEIEKVSEVTEALKWGQPSFVCKSGSTIRIDKVKDSEDIAIYFICTTNLVERFKEHYPDQFDYKGKRAIQFDLNDKMPVEELKHCIAMALTYKLKN